MTEKTFLNIREAAAYLNFRVSYLYKLTAAHQIPFYAPVGRKILFKRSELDMWVEARRVAPTYELEARAQTAAIR